MASLLFVIIVSSFPGINEFSKVICSLWIESTKNFIHSLPLNKMINFKKSNNAYFWCNQICENDNYVLFNENIVLHIWNIEENVEILRKKNNCQFRSCQFKARVKFGQKLAVRIYTNLNFFKKWFKHLLHIANTIWSKSYT